MTRFIIAQIPSPANQQDILKRPCYPKAAIFMAVFCAVMIGCGVYFAAFSAVIFALHLFGFGYVETDEECDANACELIPTAL